MVNVFQFLACLVLIQVPVALGSALPKVAMSPIDNRTTLEKVNLGRKLFFDARLSKDGSVSCNSCHSVSAGGTDNRSFSVGIFGQRGGRSAPTVLNAAFNSVQFWDGRADSLEAQAKGPLTNPAEMGMKDHAEVMARLAKIPGYVQEFASAFPGGNSLTIDNLAKAIAAYERTLITPDSPYDRYELGEKTALTDQQVRGLNKMKALGCLGCHSGANFSGPSRADGDGNFETFPIFESHSFVTQYRLMDDKGRGEVTGVAADAHSWRVPTLRNIALTAPYFHNGSVRTLEEAVRVMAALQLGETLAEADVSDIVAFLGSLTGELPPQPLPVLPPTPGETLIPTGK